MTPPGKASHPRSYGIYIEASIEADNDEDAAAVAKRLCERVFEHPSVLDCEIEVEALSGTTP